MLKAIRRYFRNLPGRYRRYYANFHHNRIYIPRQKRELAGYKTSITKVKSGIADSGTGRYCIFVLYSPNGVLQNNVVNALDAMRSNGINILACLNAPFSQAANELLAEKAHKIISRNNIGYDFGAYKDCVKYVKESFPNAEKVLILNDSIFFIENRLSQFFAEMFSDYDAVAAFENWGDNAGNHFQSFAVTISNEVFFSGAFQTFWNEYLPVSSRLHAIEEGEKKLSDAILKTAKNSMVLYTCAKLAAQLGDLDNEIVCADLVVPLRYRNMLPVDEKRTFPIGRQYRDILDIVNNSSPVHTGAWLFPQFLGAPIIKKDIVYRQRFQFWEAQTLFKGLLTDEEASEFDTMLRAKGSYEKLDAAELVRYELGIG